MHRQLEPVGICVSFPYLVPDMGMGPDLETEGYHKTTGLVAMEKRCVR